METGETLSLSAADAGVLLKAVTEQGRLFRFRARGSSMRPFIRDNDVLTVGPVNAKPMTPGDVAAVLRPEGGGLLVHRVVSCGGQTVMIKGDSSSSLAERFSKKAVVGRVTRVEREGKAVCFGAGAWGRLTALMVRSGLMIRVIAPILAAVAGFRRLLSGRVQ